MSDRAPSSYSVGGHDSQLGFPNSTDYEELGNLFAARLYFARGEFEKAQTAIERPLTRFHVPFLLTYLREAARIHAAAGDTVKAIGVHERYLLYRTEPDDLPKPQVDSVKVELETLLAATSGEERGTSR